MARKISNLSASYTRLWLVKFYTLSGYKYKIKLVSILRKREDQALISISTILKFSAPGTWINCEKYRINQKYKINQCWSLKYSKFSMFLHYHSNSDIFAELTTKPFSSNHEYFAVIDNSEQLVYGFHHIIPYTLPRYREQS